MRRYLKIIMMLVLSLIINISVLGLEHVVQKGENLTQIANMYEVTVKEILVINSLEDANKIKIGQRLLIPQNRLIIDLDKLYGAENVERYLEEGKNNTFKSDNYLLVGSMNSLSGYQGQETIYRVKSGDTINSLAKKYNIKEEQLISRNNLSPNQILKIDQFIFIPSASFEIMYPVLDEMDLLACIIAAEARGESFEGQIAVGAVILNRVHDTRFPNTIHDVIFEKNQFEVVSSGVYLKVLVPELSKRAAQEALRGRDPTNGALFFYNPRLVKNAGFFESRTVAAEIGNHIFTY